MPAKPAKKKAAPAKKAPAKKKAPATKKAPASVWTSSQALLAALRNGGDGLDESFDPRNRQHQAAVLGLPTDKLATLLALLGGPAGLRRRVPNAMAVLAEQWAMGDRPKDALKLFDALVDVDHQEYGAYGAALWAVQDDNTHLGVDPDRVRRYVKACTKYGKHLDAIHYNAMWALLEIGDHPGALAQLRAALKLGFPKDVARAQLATERLAAGVRDDREFKAAVK